MKKVPETEDKLLIEINDLKTRLSECENKLESIRNRNAVITNDKISLSKRGNTSFQFMVENMNEGVVSLDKDGKILYFNRAFNALAGHDIKLFPGMRFDVLLPESVHESFKIFLGACMNSPCRKDFEISGKGGSIIPVSISGVFFNAEKNNEFCLNIYDLSDRKKAKKKLQNAYEAVERKVRESADDLLENEQKLNAIFNAVSESIWLMNLNGDILAGNSMAVGRLGMKSDEVIGRNCFDLLPEDVGKFRKTKIKEMASSGIPVQFEDERDGIIFHHTFYPVRNRSGEITGFAIFSRDITSRRNAELERERLLHELDKRVTELNTMFSVLPYLVSLHGPDGVYLSVNPAIVKLFGFDPTKETRETIASILNARFPDGRMFTPENMPSTRALSGETITNVEYIITDKDGMDHTLLFNAFPLKIDGRIYGAVFAQMDITERKRMEEALRESEMRMRMILDHSPDMLFSQDADLRYDWFFSPETVSLPVTAIGKTDGDIFPPDETVILDEVKQKVLATGECQRVELHLTLFGEKRWFDAIYEPRFDSRGFIEGLLGYVHDITNRKLAEKDIEALHNVTLIEKNRLETVVETIPAGIAILDEIGGVVRTNRKFEEIWGGQRPLTERIEDYGFYKAWWAGSEKPVEINEWASSLALRNGEAVYGQEMHIERFDGTGMVILNSAAPFFDGHGLISGCVVAIQDITEMKNRESELNILNRTLKALSRSGKTMMHAVNEDEYLNEVCRVIVEDCGYSMVWIGFAENDEYKSIRPVAYSGFEEGYLDTLRLTWADTERGRGPTGTAIRTGTVSKCGNMQTDPLFIPWREEAVKRGYNSSIVIPIKTGRVSFGAVTIYSEKTDPFMEDEVKLLTELADDLSYGIMAIRLRNELASREERFRMLFEKNNDAVILVDDETKLIFDCNRNAEKLTGFSRMELLEKRWDDLLTSECKTEMENSLDIIINSGTFSLEAELLTSLSERVPIEISASKLTINGKSILQSIYRDISERKRYEEQLKQRAEQLVAANNELESFSYSVSHDLRAPLRTMKGFSTILMEDYTDSLDAAGKDYLGRIKNATDKMSSLIDELLGLAKISRQELRLGEIDMSALAGSIFLELSQSEPCRKVDIRVNGDMKAYGDSRLINIALTNLIGNAWKYSAKTTDARIEFGVSDIHGEKLFYIRDNGAGFDMSRSQKLFVPFQRLHPNNQFPGSGIGLAIVNKIIQRHEGRIWGEGETGKGATFYFTLSSGEK